MADALSSALVGRRIKGLSREVTWRDTTNYAAAIGDANPRYLDDSIDRGLVAPPLFAVAATWPVMTGIQEQLGGGLPMEILPTMVHSTEHLIFHRPLRPGVKLAIGGEVAAVIPGKAGTRVVLRLEAEANGEPVFTEYTGATFRGVTCGDGGGGEADLPTVPETPAGAGVAWESEIAIAPELPFVYDGCTDIVFAIHTSESFAKAVGLPGIILQGTATLALAAREIVDREAGGDPARLKEIACRFSAMVRPGTPIRVKAARDGTDDGQRVFFEVENADGHAALRSGYARVSP